MAQFTHTNTPTHTPRRHRRQCKHQDTSSWEYESKEYNWLYLCCNTSIIRQHLKNYQPFAETITSLIPKSTIRTNLQLTLNQIIPALQPKTIKEQSCNQTLAKSNMLKNYCKNILHCWTINCKINHWWTTALQLHSATETLHLLKPNKSAKKSAKVQLYSATNCQEYTCKLNRED